MLGVCVGTMLWLSVMPHAWRHLPYENDPLNISSGETLWPMARCLAGFTIGLLTHRAAVGLSRRKRTGLGDALFLAGLVAAWLVPQGDVLVVAPFPVLILRVCEDRHPLARCLASSLPYRLGEWSYAVYLLHWPALDFLRFLSPYLAQLGIAHAHEWSLALIAVLVVAASAAVHNVVEKPARSLLRKLFRRRARAIQLEPSAP